MTILRSDLSRNRIWIFYPKKTNARRMYNGNIIGLVDDENTASQTYFKERMKIGDYVLLLLDSELAIGKIVSNYNVGTESGFSYVRHVSWEESKHILEADKENAIIVRLYGSDADNKNPVKGYLEKDRYLHMVDKNHVF